MTIYLTPPSGGGAASVPSATTGVEGKVRLATTVEAQDVNNETLAVTPKALNAQINNAIVGGIEYKGSIDASTIPTALVDAVQGDFYKVSVAHANTAGTDWDIGDNLIVNTNMGGTFDAAKIDKIDSTDDDLALVATTGLYADLVNLPTIPTASTQLTDSNNLVRTNDTASQTSAGIVEIATNAETSAGASTTLAVSPAGLANELTDYTATTGLATVATTNDYNDLDNPPTIPSSSDDITSDHTGVNYTGALDASVTTHLAGIDTAIGNAVAGVSDKIEEGQAKVEVVDTVGVDDATIQFWADPNNDGTSEKIWEFDKDGHLIPDVNATYDIGKADKKVRHLFLSNNSVKFGPANDVTVTGTLSADATHLKYEGVNLATETYVATELGDYTATSGLANIATSGSYSDLLNVPAASTATSGIVELADNTETSAGTSTALAVTPAGLANELTDYTATSSLATVATTNDYGDLDNPPTLGTSAALDHGITADKIVKLNSSAKLPAVDGSLLTNLPSGGTTFSARTISGSSATANLNEFIFLESSSATSTFALTLPANPSDGDFVALSKHSWSGSSANEQPLGSLLKVEVFEGSTKLRTISSPTGNGTVFIVYDDASGAGWRFPTTGTNVREQSGSGIGNFPNDFGSSIELLTYNGNVTYQLYDASYVIEGRKATLYKMYAGDLTIETTPSSLNLIYDVSTNTYVNSITISAHGVFVDILVDANGKYVVSTPPNLSLVATTNDYNDLDNLPTLGTSAALDHGITADKIVKLDGSGKLPAVDGSLLINLPSGGATTLNALTDVNVSGLAENEVLKYNGSTWVNSVEAYQHEKIQLVSGHTSSTYTVTQAMMTDRKILFFHSPNVTNKHITIELPSSLSQALNDQVRICCSDSEYDFLIKDSTGNNQLIISSNGAYTYANTGATVRAGTDAVTIKIIKTSDPNNPHAFFVFNASQTSSDDLTGNHTGVNYTGATTDTLTTHLANIDTALGSVGGIASVSADTAPALGANLDVAGFEITSTSNGDVAINPNGTGDISIGADLIPDANNTHTIGDENNRYVSYYGDMNGAIRFKAKNNQGAQLTKGQVVFISGVSGTVPQVQLAQANSSSTMPAFGLVQANANAGADVEIVTLGNLTDYNTTTHNLLLNDTVYVSATTAGALTKTPPTTEANLIQNIGRVVRADSSAGIIKVGGAGRSNATPNLNDGYIFLGNNSDQAVSTELSTVALDLTLSNVGNVLTARNNLGLGTSATQDYGTAAHNVIILDSNLKLPAVDGSQLTNVGKFVDYDYKNSPNSTAATFKNKGYQIDAGGITLTLPDRATVSDGDFIAITTEESFDVIIALHANDVGTNNIFRNVATGTHSTTSHTITVDRQEIFVRFNGSAWLIVSQNKMSELSEDTTPVLGGNLDVSTFDIVSSSNNNIEFAANGTGVVKVTPTTTGGHLELNGDGTNAGKLRLMCEQNSHGIYLQSPPNSATASYTLTFPTGLGSADDVLKTDASGNLSWTAQSGGFTYSAITADPANAQANYHYSCGAGDETFTITLPTSGVSAGEEIRIKNMGTGTITIDPQTRTIDSSSDDYVLDVRFSAITLVSTGSNWEVI